MYQVIKRLVLVFLLIGLAVGAFAQTGEQVFSSAIGSYQNGRYDQALTQFRQLLLDPQYAGFRGDAYFWIAKVLIAQNRVPDAERNLEFFLANFPENANYPEGLYLRGRILFLSADWESAIQAFSQFIETYPNSPFVANAYYWTGESLFSLGQLEAAEQMFNAVIREFPTSARVEASRYRIAVVGMSRREQELLRLLQWTQEESLKTIEEFRQQELELEEALASYQSRLADLSDDAFQEEIDSLIAQVDELETENSSLRQQIDEYSNTVRRLENEIRNLENNTQSAAPSTGQRVSITTNDPDFAIRLELLSLKESSLALKAELIESLENLLEDFENEQGQ
jgi:TolA-binding protein